MVSVTVNKNLWGYGVSTFLIPWVVKSGFVAPLWVLGATGFVVHLAAIPLYFYGKRLRRSTKDSFVHKM